MQRKILLQYSTAIYIVVGLAVSAHADATSCTGTVTSLMAEAKNLPASLKTPLQEYLTSQPDQAQGQVTREEQIAAFLMHRQTLLNQILAEITTLQQQPAQNVENNEQVLAQLTKVMTACQ